MEVDAPNSGPVAGGPDSSPFAGSFAGTGTPRTSAPDSDFVRPAFEKRVRHDSAAAAEPAKAETAEDKAAAARKRFHDFEQFVQGYMVLSLSTSKWQFLDEGVQQFRLDVPGVEFAESVRKQYSDELAVGLGLFTRTGEKLQPADWLNNSPLYVKTDSENFKVSFSRNTEGLFPNEHSALDIALERADPESTAQTGTLFVVDSEEAADILQRLELAAVSCEGLSELDRHNLARLFEGDFRTDISWRYSLLLVDFDVWAVKNQRMPAIRSVIERLADAADVYEIDPARRFAICRPTGEEFQQLERAIAFEDPSETAMLFDKWAAAAQKLRITNWRSYVDNEPATLSATRAALTRAVTRQNLPFNNDEIRGALAAYRAAGADVAINRFYEAAERENNPFDQLELIAAAACAEDFFSNDPLVRRAEAILLGKNPPSVAEMREEVFERQRNSLAELRRLRRERRGKR